MDVSTQTNTAFVCAWGGRGGQRARVCVCIHMQYDTHSNWWTGEEWADRACAKSAAAGTYDDDAFFDFPNTPWGSIYARGSVN